MIMIIFIIIIIIIILWSRYIELSSSKLDKTVDVFKLHLVLKILKFLFFFFSILLLENSYPTVIHFFLSFDRSKSFMDCM